MKRLAILFLLLGGLLVSAIGQNPIPTQARHSTPGAKHTSGKHTTSKLKALALPTAGGSNLTIRKDVCSSVTAQFTCSKDTSQDTKTVTYTVYDCTAANSCVSGSPITGTSIGTGTLTIGNPGGSGGASGQVTFNGALVTGTTYAICETSNTFTAAYYSVPRPSQSSGGQQSSVGPVNPLATNGECLFLTANSGNNEADFLNVLKSTIDTPTPTATATNTPVPPTATPTNTPVVPTATATNTPTNTPVVPTATATNTPTNTPVVPTATATNTPTTTPVLPTSTPTNTPTNTPVAPTATATNTPTNTPTSTPPPAAVNVSIHKCVIPNITTTACMGSYGNSITMASGANITYVVTIDNSGSGTVSNVTATDTLAAGQTYITSVNNCIPAPGCTFNVLTNTVTFNTGPIAAHTSISFYVYVAVGTGPEPVLNTAFITSPTTGQSETTTVTVPGATSPVITPIIPVVVVSTPIPTVTAIPTSTPVPPTATSAPPTSTNTPISPTPTAVPATNTPTSTPVPPTATVTSQNGSARNRPTKTPQPTKKSTGTEIPATAVPTTAATTATRSPAVVETPQVPPATLPVTGFGGGSVAHNVAIGHVFRAAHGNVALGSTTLPQTGGGAGSMTPILPVILGAIVLALGALTRRFAFAKR